MQIIYRNKKLKKILETEKKLIKNFGKEAALKISRRLREIQSVKCLEDLPPTARAHPYEPKEKGMFSIDILKHKHPIRMIISAKGKFELNDRKTITKIQIEKIIKTHS